MTRFTNKTVVITGAASGIGLAVAKRFSDEGANVVALDLDQAKTELAIKGLPANRSIARACDTSKAEDDRPTDRSIRGTEHLDMSSNARTVTLVCPCGVAAELHGSNSEAYASLKSVAKRKSKKT